MVQSLTIAWKRAIVFEHDQSISAKRRSRRNNLGSGTSIFSGYVMYIIKQLFQEFCVLPTPSYGSPEMWDISRKTTLPAHRDLKSRCRHGFAKKNANKVEINGTIVRTYAQIFKEKASKHLQASEQIILTFSNVWRICLEERHKQRLCRMDGDFGRVHTLSDKGAFPSLRTIVS